MIIIPVQTSLANCKRSCFTREIAFPPKSCVSLQHGIIQQTGQHPTGPVKQRPLSDRMHHYDSVAIEYVELHIMHHTMPCMAPRSAAVTMMIPIIHRQSISRSQNDKDSCKPRRVVLLVRGKAAILSHNSRTLSTTNSQSSAYVRPFNIPNSPPTVLIQSRVVDGMLCGVHYCTVPSLDNSL